MVITSENWFEKSRPLRYGFLPSPSPRRFLEVPCTKEKSRLLAISTGSTWRCVHGNRLTECILQALGPRRSSPHHNSCFNLSRSQSESIAEGGARPCFLWATGLKRSKSVRGAEEGSNAADSVWLKSSTACNQCRLRGWI